jgi:NAD(P)-dependent dehydrogenase (short-subunit alcohol dehydrogenase family)
MTDAARETRGAGHFAGKRVVVVGASAGIGRAFAAKVIEGGARTVIAARRSEPLAAMIEAGQSHRTVSAITVDICDSKDRGALLQRIVDELGGVDLLLCSVGSSMMRWFGQATAEDWRAVLEVNVIGVHQLISDLLPVLAPGSIVAVMSSESTSEARSGVGIYSASKAALERSMVSWRTEYPGIRFSCVIVGATVPTDFGVDFEAEMLGPALEDWGARGLLQEEFMATDDVASVIANVYGGALDYPGVNLESLTVRSPSRVVGTTSRHDPVAVRAQQI